MFALFFFTLITSKKIYLNGKYGTWSRDGKDAITLEQLSDGSYHVKHTGEQDFTVTAQDTVELIPGDKIKLAIDFNIKQGLGQIVYIPYDSQNKTIGWNFGRNVSTKTNQQEHVESTSFIPGSTSYVQFRVIDSGPCDFTFKNYYYEILDHLNIVEDKVVLVSNSLDVTFDTIDFNFEVHDIRTNRIWNSSDDWFGWRLIDIPILKATFAEFVLYHSTYLSIYSYTVELFDDEINFTLHGDPDGNITPPRIPKDILSRKGDRILVPYGEGLSIPADTVSLRAT